MEVLVLSLTIFLRDSLEEYRVKFLTCYASLNEVKWSEVKVAQLCLTLCDPMDYIVHEILQARILEWVVFLFSRGCSQPRDQMQVSCTAGRFFTSWATREAQSELSQMKKETRAILLSPFLLSQL